MHTPATIEDNRKRLIKKSNPERKHVVTLPQFSILTELGLHIRTNLIVAIENHLNSVGRESFAYSRKFFESNISRAHISNILEQLYPGIEDKMNTKIKSHQNYHPDRTDLYDIRCYKRLWGMYCDQTKQNPKERFHPTAGKRHWRNHEKLNSLVLECFNTHTVYGRALSYEYDLENPDQRPTIKVKKFSS
jgi:hypothetical protein